MLKKELVIAPVSEAALILIAAIIGWASHQPLVFASLGPTIYEMIETPKQPSARPYNVVVGHLIGVLAAFAAIYILQGWNAPQVSALGVPLTRVWTATLAALITVVFTLIARAKQPAALATTLLISLGLMQTWVQGGIIMGGVVLITLLGEPIRRMRLQSLSANNG